MYKYLSYKNISMQLLGKYNVITAFYILDAKNGTASDTANVEPPI